MSAQNPTGPSASQPLPPISQEMLPGILANPNLPKIYMQSFVNFASAVEVNMLIANCGVPNAMVTMSYPTAKSLANALNQVVEAYERAMGSPVLSTEDAQARFMPGYIK